MLLENKNALVTGASGAIGGAICEELLQNQIKNLAILDIQSEEPKIAADWRKRFPSASIKYFRVDVSSHEQLKNCYAKYTAEVSSLDIVVNCAGIFNENLYKTVLDVNLGGVIGSTLLAIDYMRADKGKGRGGIVLNIASVAGLSTFSIMPIYCATKHGVISFTRAIAHGREDMGIKFLILCPNATDSKLFDNVISVDYLFMTNKEKLAEATGSLPVQSPSEVGKAAVQIMKDGENGDTWIIGNGELQKASLPEVPF